MVVSSRSGKNDAIGIEGIFPIEGNDEGENILDRLAELDGAIYAIESVPKKLS